eukprot:3107287-Prymnesium_polylepis.1
MLRDQRVQKSELWAAGAGFVNRCEQAGESGGEFSLQCAQGGAPDCTGPGKSTIAVNLHSIFVRLIAIFAANSYCGPTLPQVRMSR